MMERALAGTVARLAERVGGTAGGVTVAELNAAREAVGAEVAGTYEELRIEAFRRVLETHGLGDPYLPRWMFETWMSERLAAVAVHPDVEPEIEALADAGHVLGAITNGNFPVDRLPLARRFAFVVHAEHVGAMKPAAAPFLHAAELAGGHPDRWVHVGDDLELDVAGAQACGMWAVWVNRTGAALPDGYRPDAELPSLEGLTSVVARLLPAA
jgi:HAD superfamily hydrolase (TIGR01509 family)